MLRIIVNPTAGNGKAKRVGAQVEAALKARNIAHEVFITETAGHATELARAAADAGVDTAVAVGGDGTLLEVVRGLHGTDVALGIIPAGTGNDVIKMLGLPKDPMQALDAVLEKPARPLDAGQLNDGMFLNVTGTGLDVLVLHYALQVKKYINGTLPYIWGVIRALCAYKPIHVTIEVDGEAPEEREIMIAAVANGRFIGGGLNVAPDARPDDGMFDLVVVESMPIRKIIPHLPKLLNGRLKEMPHLLYRNCREVKFTSPGMEMNVDGEIVPMDSAHMRMLPGALRAHW